ncbi:carbohydrate-binding protein, partial [Micromonospora echinofusca]
MSRLRALIALTALVVTGSLVAIIPSTPASAATCAASWQSSAVYQGGDQVSHNGRNYQAKWWTQNEAPPGSTGVWQDLGACDGGTTPPPGGTCTYPNWVAGTWYVAGSIVRYTNGLHYIAEHDNPGYDPVISTWYWEPYTCGG